MQRSKLLVLGAVVLALALVVVGLAVSGVLFPSKPVVVLATTTSTQNSGLLDYILPDFESRFGARVSVVAVGSGQALDIARRGDADVVLAHAPSLEESFMQEGYGIFRWQVMYNQFAVVGPSSDPAGVATAVNASAALRKIADNSSIFLSRADNSGTNVKELQIWWSAGLDPGSFGSWYKEVGKGMEETLQMAGEMGGYTLTDEGTFFALEGKLTVVELFRSDNTLYNQYSVISVSPTKSPSANVKYAILFSEWLVSDRTQELIASYKVSGHQLFYPNAVPP